MVRPPSRLHAVDEVGSEDLRAAPRSPDGAATSPRGGRSPAMSRPRARGSPGSSAGRRARACSGVEAGSARSTRSRSASVRASSPWKVGSSMGRMSTSIGRRRRRRASSRQAFTSRRWSQASNRSGSRKPGEVLPGAHQGVLDRVARELAVPEDEARGRVQPGTPPSRARRRRRDRLAPPAPRAPSVHGPLTLARRSRGRVCRVWRHRKPIRFAIRAPSGVRAGSMRPGPRPRRRRTAAGRRAPGATPGRRRTPRAPVEPARGSPERRPALERPAALEQIRSSECFANTTSRSRRRSGPTRRRR